eukprot:jgi/Ulvmu1/11576/UM079_0019.1
MGQRTVLTHEEDANGALLKEQLQLVKVHSTNGDSRYHVKQIARPLGFDKGFYVCVRALQLLVQHNQGCTFVGVGGASGSGKTTFTDRLKKVMNNVVVLSMDMYNDGSKVLENNFDDPRIIDFHHLHQNIEDLQAGKSTKVPIYDFKQSKRVGYRDVAAPESRVIIIEGIYALSQRIASLLDLKVAITGGVHFDLVKRVMRDIQRSGQAAGEVIQQVSETVFPMYKAFIEPDLNTAEIKVTNNFNPFAGFKEPIQILKTDDSCSVDMAYDVLTDMYPNAEISRENEIEVHDIFLLPPGEDLQGCQSWLRMRNKEGRYSLMFAEYVLNDPFIVSPRVTFEVPVRILGGLMALGYTIGTIMSRTSFRVVCKDICIKWDRIDKLGCFVQVQGERRTEIMSICSSLGIQNFMPRSYIEQVQMMKLTQDFAEITDKARQHFTVGDDVIIDDHVIGASPARRLVFNSMPHRHSTDDSLLSATTAQKPHRTITGWTASAPVDSGLGSSNQSPRKGAPAQQRPTASQLSLELNAAAVASPREADLLRSRRSSGNLLDRTGFGKAPAMPAGVSVGSPQVAASNARSARRQHSIDSTAQRPSWVKDPEFWVPNKGPNMERNAELAVLQKVHCSLEAAVLELHAIASTVQGSNTVMLGAAAGFAAGVALTLLSVWRYR